MGTNARYSRFEQIRRTIKEAQDYLLVGVDVGKDTHHACLMLSSGRMLEKHFAFENNQSGYHSFLKLIQDLQKASLPKETILGLETTGNYMVPLAHFLEEKGLFVVMVSSMVAKRNRDTLDLSWNKNDPKDALNVTDCMKQGKILYFPYQETPYGDLKRLMNLFGRLSRERGHHKVRLQNNLLCILFPEFTQVFEEVDELVPMTILKHYPTPSHITQVSEESFVQDIVQKTDPTIKKSKLRRIHQLARESIGSREDQTSLLIELKYTLDEIGRLKTLQERLLREVQRLTKELHDYELLQTIPGVGPVIGAVFLSEIGNIQNFHSSRQILKLAGLDLARIQSGQQEGTFQISRRGRPALRSAAFQAGLVAARAPSPLRLKYLRIVEGKKLQKGQRRKAVIAVSCKILRIAYSVLKTKRPYETGYDFAVQGKTPCATIAA